MSQMLQNPPNYNKIVFGSGQGIEGLNGSDDGFPMLLIIIL